MTYEEKLAVAARLRASNFVEPTFEPEYLQWMEQVDSSELELPVAGREPVKAYLHQAKNRDKKGPMVLNVHGGGFVRGHMPCNTYFSGRMAAQLRGTVLDLDYHLAPEYPFPVAFEESYAAAQWIFDHWKELDNDPENVSMVGHSAGASLTLSVAMKAASEEAFRLRRIVLDFGAFDLSVDPADKPGAATNVLSVERMRAFTTLYTDDDPAVIQNPYVSASFAPDELLRNLPQTVIVAAGQDSLRQESFDLGIRLVSLGVPVAMQCFLHSNHGFTVQCTGEWKQSQAYILHQLGS